MAEPTREPGHSQEQQDAELHLVAGLSKLLGVNLKKKRILDPDGEWLEIDAYSESPLILCEAWAHIGTAKASQKNKIMADAFKLIHAEKLISTTARKILLFADEAAARHFLGRSWMARALKDRGIEIQVVNLSADVHRTIIVAQGRQYR